MTTYPQLPQGDFQGYQNAPGGIPPAYQMQSGYPAPTGIPSPGGLPQSIYPPPPATSLGFQKHSVHPPSAYGPRPSATSPRYQTQPMAPTSGPPPPVGFLPQNMPSGAYAQQTSAAKDNDHPSAPPINEMKKLPGYEHVTFDSVVLTPPSDVDSHKESPIERQDLGRLPTISEEQVQEALIQHVSENCCYGNAPAKDMVIRDIQMSSAFHYSLETFGEKRETAWAFEPYSGQQLLDTAMNGPAPAPWEIVVLPKTYFKNAVRKVEVPHTAVARPCHTCVGIGRVRCEECQGNGQTRCTSCKNGMRDEGQCTSGKNGMRDEGQCTSGKNGMRDEGLCTSCKNGMRDEGQCTSCKNGMSDEGQCTSCSGSGHTRCFKCIGTGQIKCNTCSGKCNLKCFVQLTVRWKNHLEDFISDKVTLPDDCIREVSGQVVFEEKQPKVRPITHSPDVKINKASVNLINKHSRAFPKERILQQRHKVRIIPIAEVPYSWKSKEGSFFVYGFENKVYFPDYPQQYCCGCVIL